MQGQLQLCGLCPTARPTLAGRLVYICIHVWYGTVWYGIVIGGTNSSIFLSIWDRFDPQVALGVVLYIKLKTFFKIVKTEFLPSVPGV